MGRQLSKWHGIELHKATFYDHRAMTGLPSQLVCAWLTGQSFPLIPQPLLPQGEKGSWTKMFSKSPSPALGEGLG
jgi:hypothetical protein